MKKISRRKFLNNTAKGTVGLLAYPLLKTSNAGQFDNSRVVVIEHDSVLTGSTINQSVVQVMIDAGISSLTGIQDLGEAWKSLFPGITQNKVIGIKVSLLNRHLATHPKVTNCVINGLTSMQVEGSPFPENNIIIWDRWNSDLTNAGYTINTGSTGARCFGTNQSGIGYDSTYHNINGSQQRISKVLTDLTDYIVNLNVLKNHNFSGVTLSLKNHYGSCHYPGGLHGGHCDPYIPALNNLSYIKDKQVISICDGIFGIISNGPLGFPQITPKTIIMATDPVAHDYTGAQILQTNGCTTLNIATHIATAAQSPYNLGTNDPTQIDLINISNPTSIDNENYLINTPDKFRLLQNYPNPFNSQTTFPYQLFKSADVKIDIYDISGKHICNLANAYQNIGYHKAIWNGKTSGGKIAASGNYICKFKIDKDIQTFRVQLLK
jgi:uncharacterized protein (DUF362 family)